MSFMILLLLKNRFIYFYLKKDRYNKKMRKLLGLIGAFALTASASSSIVACSNPAEPTYNTIAAAIQALNLTSYAKKGTSDVNRTVNDIKQDAINVLSTSNYVSGITFVATKLELDPTRIINSKTKLALAENDLKDDAVLSLELTFTYDNKEGVKASSSQLNVTTKTDQAIVDYINGYNFSKFTSKISITVGTDLELFQFLISKEGSLSAIIFMGSFSVFIDKVSFHINTIKKGNAELTQADLNKAGTLGITVNYKYKAIENQSFNFNVNISKIDISEVKVIYPTNLPITLPDTSKNHLTEEAVDKIKTAITTAIQTALAKATDDLITTTDYEVTGIESTVKKGADFTNQTPVTFTIIAKSDSPKFTGKLDKQSIKVTVTDKP